MTHTTSFLLAPVPVLVGDSNVELILPETGVAQLKMIDADSGVPLPRVLVSWEMEVEGRSIRPQNESLWHPGVDGAGSLKLPIGKTTLTLDATLLGYPLATVRDFELDPSTANEVKVLLLRRTP